MTSLVSLLAFTLSSAPPSPPFFPVDCIDPSCSAHGVCIHGECHCQPGWGGANCEIEKAVCPDQCSGHGTFNAETSSCTCNQNWTGPDCSLGGWGRGCGQWGRGCGQGGWEGAREGGSARAPSALSHSVNEAQCNEEGSGRRRPLIGRLCGGTQLETSSAAAAN